VVDQSNWINGPYTRHFIASRGSLKGGDFELEPVSGIAVADAFGMASSRSCEDLLIEDWREPTKTMRFASNAYARPFLFMPIFHHALGWRRRVPFLRILDQLNTTVSSSLAFTAPLKSGDLAIRHVVAPTFTTRVRQIP